VRAQAPKVQVRYIVNDVDAAAGFYCQNLGFNEDFRPSPSVALLSRGDLRLVLSTPDAGPGGTQAAPDESRSEPGGWNRFAIQVSDLPATVEKLRKQGVHFRSEMITSAVGRQILIEDPSGNPVELFEPTLPEARLNAPASEPSAFSRRPRPC
jgi:catechol 2,3-dioxygenase-like lactoylglutathione lyase family enzyme